MSFKLVTPSLDMEKEYNYYITEWEKSGEKIVPYASRRDGMDFENLLLRWESDSSNDVLNKGLVPATILFMVDESGRIYGSIHIRHKLNDNLLKKGGHIGYGVRPSERRKGIAKKMLLMVLPFVKEFGIDRALITCDKDNTASAKTIISNGGILENEMLEGDKVVQRYWINL
jgi:predicted acetyltransferase